MHPPFPTFSNFFKDEIDHIRTQFVPYHFPDPFLFPPASPPATLTEIYKLISESKKCPLDSIPTFLLKLCFNELGPIITTSVNLSLGEGMFPSSFKQALVQLFLKIPLYLLTIDLNNFRSIPNLNFISEILEKDVASRIQSHLSSNSLFSSFPSAQRIFHSNETTIRNHRINDELLYGKISGSAAI